MPIPRDGAPYIWVTWLTRLLVGESSCEWSAWFRAQNQVYDRVPDDFDSTAWTLKHTALLNEVRPRLEADNYDVFSESQNKFTLRSEKTGVTLGGKPDLIATKQETGTIIDVKTGRPKASDPTQVMIYMWAVPLALQQYKGMVFDGRVAYADHEVPIPTSAVDDSFAANLSALIRKVSGSEPPRRVPSVDDCKFCPIAQSECDVRVEVESDGEAQGVTDF